MGRRAVLRRKTWRIFEKGASWAGGLLGFTYGSVNIFIRDCMLSMGLDIDW